MTLSFRELQNQLQPGWGFQHVGDGPDVDLLVVLELAEGEGHGRWTGIVS